jgi:integrase/recombinase XerC
VSACREFYRWARGRKKLPDNPFMDLGRIRGEKRLPRFLEQGQVTSLISAAATVSGRKKHLSARNVAIVEVFYATGGRLGEIHGLDLVHVSQTAGTALLYGKGRKERLVPIGKKALEALALYLPQRKQLLEQKERFYEQALFVSERGSRLSRDAIQEVIEKAGAKLGLDVHCHMLRHSYGTHLVEGGAELQDLQDLLGHEYLETTRKYVHTATSRLKGVYDRTHPRA